MDLNFADLKKEAASTAEDIFSHKTEVLNQGNQAATKSSHDLLGGPSGHQDDNAHTEHYFANEQKEPNPKYVDPQTFVQQMSAGAKEAQEELDAIFGEYGSDFADLRQQGARDAAALGAQMQSARQGLASLTHDFMNAERGIYAGAGDPIKPTAAAPAVPAPVVVDDGPLFDVNFGNGDGNFAPSAPSGSGKHFEDDDFNVKSSTSTKDSDTESPSVSYNPSPIKKNPVADALREQDNEAFISSEDLLGDFKEERTATPEFHAASAAATAAVAKATAAIPTTDLDDDEDDDSEKHFVRDNKAFAGFSHSQVENVKDTTPLASFATSVVAPPPAPVVVPAPVAAAVKPAAFSEPAKPAQVSAPTPTPTMKSAPPPPPSKPVPKHSSDDQPKIVSVEEIFYKYGLDAWFKPERLHPRVESLIYWRDVKKSGIVFGAGLVVLLAISCFSVISVFAYLSLLTLAGTVAFRMYKSVMQAVQKTNDGHPFDDFLNFDLKMSPEKVDSVAKVAVAHVNGFTSELQRLFLVQDLIDSIKFGVILWVMTYIGAWFNGMTLVILAFVALFTLPKVYENNKQSIDNYLDLVRSKLTEVTDKIKEAIPIGNKKPIAVETDKDK